MREGMKGDPEESLLRALAEFADETSLETASDRVRQTLRREVRAKARRRWAFAGLAAAFATAAALAAVLFGITTHSRRPAAQPFPQTVARENRAPVTSAARPSATMAAATVTAETVAPASVTTAVPMRESPTAGVRPATARRRSGSMAVPLVMSSGRGQASGQSAPAAEWRRGEVVLSPWYFNTALPPSARSVLVRSEVDARTAMRFGVVSAGDTAPVEILFGEDGLPRAMRFVRRLPTQKN
jgi:hypothetical protein